ncbi:hypothetical protein VTL71DRAFT_7891 [Oculimacula yallundae]|uniref:Uncharacterized protein n=1 Tax=Oculimacula yallundae TaxID=86028 RepID=A0ABR4CWE3_9HELO
MQSDRRFPLPRSYPRFFGRRDAMSASALPKASIDAGIGDWPTDRAGHIYSNDESKSQHGIPAVFLFFGFHYPTGKGSMQMRKALYTSEACPISLPFS